MGRLDRELPTCQAKTNPLQNKLSGMIGSAFDTGAVLVSWLQAVWDHTTVRNEEKLPTKPTQFPEGQQEENHPRLRFSWELGLGAIREGVFPVNSLNSNFELHGSTQLSGRDV